MERKSYSHKPIPRQTLWNQKQKRKREEDLARVHKERALPGRGSVSAKDKHADSEEEDKVSDLDAGDIAHPSQQAADVFTVADIPLYKPVRKCDSDPYASSDEDLSTTFEINPLQDDSDLDCSDDESVTSPMQDLQDDLHQNKEECLRLWLTSGNAMHEAASSEGEFPPCPPDVKFPVLVHLLKTKHELTKEAVDDVMEIINDLSTISLSKTVLPKDARTLGKMFEPFLSDVEKHFLCKTCSVYVGRQKIGNETYLCRSCKSSQIFKESDFFYYLPLADQLRQCFETSFNEVSIAFQTDVRDNRSLHLIRSIRDGSRYIEYLNTIGNSKHHLSLSFSCDGVPVFSSSKSSLWPVLCTINELPMSIRKRYVFMPALWYGVGNKPDMNQFLYPFVKEAIALHERGFTFYESGKEQRCRVSVLKNISDSVARPLLLLSQQFNGEFGCTDCYHPGEQVPKGRGTVRVYRHRTVSRRTSEETMSLAKEAAKLDQKPFHIKGIKGESILSHLPCFHIIDGLIVDYMHASILGTARQFAKLWLSPKYSSKKFYIGDRKEVINSRLRKLQPPFNVSRVPRSEEEMKFWKGHEFYFWSFVYSIPVLKGLLPNNFLRHWMLFVEGLFLLTQESIAKSQVYNAMDLLAQFTKGTEELYGIENCTFNVHLGEHLGETVLRWGPLWENSAFLYEDYNQVLLKAIHSSKGVLDQVVNQIRTANAIPCILSTPVGSSVAEMKVSKKDQMISTRNSVSTSNALVLSPYREEIPHHVRLAFASRDIIIKLNEMLLFSRRIIAHGEIFHSKAHKLVKKRNSYTVLLNEGKLLVAKEYVVVKNSCFAVGKYLERDNSYMFVPERNALSFHVCVKKKLGPVCVVDVSEFLMKVVFLRCDHLPVNVVCIPQNRDEVLK